MVNGGSLKAEHVRAILGKIHTTFGGRRVLQILQLNDSMTSPGDMSPQKVSDFELGFLSFLSPNTQIPMVNYGITMLWVKKQNQLQVMTIFWGMTQLHEKAPPRKPCD